MLKPSLTLKVPVDALRVGDESLHHLADPLEVLPGRAERFFIETTSGRALLLRARIYYNRTSSIAKNVALYDSPENLFPDERNSTDK